MERPRNITIAGRRFSGARYPYDHLNVGDEFYVPVARASPMTVRELVRRRNKKGRGLFDVSPAADGGSYVFRLDESTVIGPLRIDNKGNP